MPVRNRKYEEILQLLFGALIALVLLDAVVHVIIRIVKACMHK